jgi:hypothetical protein
MSLIVLDPTGTGEKEISFELAERPLTLDGKILGVIDNGKHQANVVLQFVMERLQRDYRLAQVKWIKKPSVSHPISAEQIEQLKECHLVLSGIGD